MITAGDLTIPIIDGRALPPIWLEKLNAFMVASHPSMAKKPKKVHEYLESLLSIPVEEGGIHSERKLPSRRWVVIQLEPWRRPDHVAPQPLKCICGKYDLGEMVKSILDNPQMASSGKG